ncbi:MAG TPA: trypsin-like peptidase domain-containing protein [Pilimelia sp.]|nr:trypsin-like peptidase domain-containing protein [Pilimelia sp.]
MTEYDDNPQRQPAGSDAGAAHPTTELPTHPGGEPATSQQPAVGPYEPSPYQPAGPQQPGAQHPGAQHPGAQHPGPYQPESPYQPAPPYQPDAGYQPGHPYQQQPAGYQPGQPYPPYAGGPAAGAGEPQPGPGALPPWATPVGGAPQGPYEGQPAGHGPGPWAPAGAGAGQRPGGFRRVAVLGTAAVVLSLGSGLLGGVIATQLDEERTPTTLSSDNRPAVAAPTVDRSSLAGIARSVQPTVVSISTGSGEGSGVVLRADGYVLTNNHVVANAQGNALTVVFSDGKTAQAELVGTDARTDLAVVKLKGNAKLAAAKFGDSSSMQVGDTVLALGSPLGLQGSVTAGIVSALDRTIRTGGSQQDPPLTPQTGVTSMSGLLQTDAPINPGNSGGALVNLAGEVIGINTAIATSGQGAGNIGVGFAIPSNRAKQVADQLVKGEKVSHPFLGVNVGDSQGDGAVVATVQPNSPAASVGLQRGDVVTKIGGRDIKDSDDLVSAVQTGKVGDRLDITYVRNGEQKSATVTLGEAS